VRRIPSAALLAVPVALVIAGCSSSSHASSAKTAGTPHPTITPAAGGVAHAVPVQGNGCVSQSEATRIWTQVDSDLNAIELDPKHTGVAAVATGDAERLIDLYLQQQLEASSFTEREVDRLDTLSVVDAGCSGGQLELRVTIDLVQDDYLKPDGHVDHADSQVGSTIHFDETFTRAGGAWKESSFMDLDQATPTPQLF